MEYNCPDIDDVNLILFFDNNEDVKYEQNSLHVDKKYSYHGVTSKKISLNNLMNFCYKNTYISEKKYPDLINMIKKESIIDTDISLFEKIIQKEIDVILYTTEEHQNQTDQVTLNYSLNYPDGYYNTDQIIEVLIKPFKEAKEYNINIKVIDKNKNLILYFNNLKNKFVLFDKNKINLWKTTYYYSNKTYKLDSDTIFIRFDNYFEAKYHFLIVNLIIFNFSLGKLVITEYSMDDFLEKIGKLNKQLGLAIFAGLTLNTY